MASKWTVAACVMLLLLVAAAPRMAKAADWQYSPYRAQLADLPSAGQAEEETTAAPADMTGKKSIGKGVMFSLVIPGAGQLYGGQWWRALPWFAIEVAGWAMFAKYHGDGQDKTEEFEAFAGPRDTPNNFNANVYLLREYQIAAQNPTTPFTQDLSTWKTLPWDGTQGRQSYVEYATGYGHDVLTDDIQQFFEMIGKYINQFGYGWDDTHDPALDPNSESLDPALWAVSGDDPATLTFDGDSPLFYQYRDMRGEANDLLDKGNIAMEVVLVNHVLSALDAAFTVRSYNKKIEQSGMGELKFKYDIKSVDGATARFMTMSLALN